MSDDFFGPASDGAVTTRPTLTPQMTRAGGSPTWFAPCSSEDAEDGTQASAEWLNLLVANLDAVRDAAGIGAGDETPGGDEVLLASILALIEAAVPSPDLSPYLLKAGGSLTGGGHISDPVDPTSSDHLVRLGYLTAQLAGLGAGRLLGLEVVTATGTWTRPGGVTKALVVVTGGGGAGGYDGSGGSSVAAGGGGAGATAISLVDVSALASVACTVGAGGTGHTGYIGAAGGSTSFGIHAVAAGGSGGGIAGSGYRYGGLGGLATAGDMRIGGGGGGGAGGAIHAGEGGASFWGGGGAGNAVLVGLSPDARAYGAGGAAGGTLTATCGDGGDGVILILEFA